MKQNQSSLSKQVFLSTHIVAVPHLPLSSRYLLTKVRSVDGFYGVTMRKGYLDRMGPEVNEILERIVAIERMVGGNGLELRLAEIRTAGDRISHMWVMFFYIEREMAQLTNLQS
jgi:KUP system potassium uptake protein